MRDPRHRQDLSDVPLPLLVESWLLAARAMRSSEHTLRLYSSAMRQFLHYLGNDPDLLSVDRKTVREWLVHMEESKYEDSTRRTHFRVIRGFYKWAASEDEIEKNPTDLVRLPKIPRAEPEGLSDEQVSDLLDIPGKDFYSRRDLAIFSVFLDTGLRREELVRLAVSAPQLQTGNLTVLGKGNKTRTTLMGVKARLAVDKYIRLRARHPNAGLEGLWLTQSGVLTYPGLQRIFVRHGERIGLPGLHPHMLRHTWASKVRKAGISDGDLMRLGGWSTRAMIDLYGSYEADYRAQEAYRGNSVLDKLK